MRWKVIRQFSALLSLSYLSMLLSLSTWAMLPAIIGWTPTIVMSGSMEPNIVTGDIVIAQPVTDEVKKAIVPGQVLLAKDPSHPDTLVTHRVVNVIEGEGFITKGDANAKADPTMIPFENVQGLERLRIPMIGLPLQAVRAENYNQVSAFIIITIIAQLIIWREWKFQRTLQLPTTKSEQQPLTTILTKNKVTRMMVLTNVVLVATTPFLVSSEAIFSGGTSNAGNMFATSTNFLSGLYSKAVLADSPLAYYRLNETAGIVTADSSLNGNNASYSPTGVGYGKTGALKNNPTNTAVTLDGTQGEIIGKTVTAGQQSLTVEMWFKTTTVRGGQMLGFYSGSGVSAVTDRVIYMGRNGQILFGTSNVTKETIETPLTYNDGKWHLITATLSGLTASLYIDGRLISSATTASPPATTSGYWVVGGDSKLNGWIKQPNNRFAGSLDEVAIYSEALSATKVMSHYSAG